MWKIRTAQNINESFISVECCRMFTDGQEGCLRGTREIDDMLYTDQFILKDAKTRRKM